MHTFNSSERSGIYIQKDFIKIKWKIKLIFEKKIMFCIDDDDREWILRLNFTHIATRHFFAKMFVAHFSRPRTQADILIFPRLFNSKFMFFKYLNFPSLLVINDLVPSRLTKSQDYTQIFLRAFCVWSIQNQRRYMYLLFWQAKILANLARFDQYMRISCRK